MLPNWVGDAVMATPAIELLRENLKGTFLGALCRPGIDEIFEGCDLFDEVHVERGSGVFGPKFMAAKVRPRRYEAALLLTNSFSSALVARIAGIPRRVGYNRDGRGFLLTEKLLVPKRGDGSWAIIPACRYYYDAAESLLHEEQPRYNALALATIPLAFPAGVGMKLRCSPRQSLAGERFLSQALASRELPPTTRFAVLNPGGNNPAKRWPAARYAAIADLLYTQFQLPCLVNGSPAEQEIVSQVVEAATLARPIGLPFVQGPQRPSLSTLKHIISRAALVVTNDTGPRHIAAAFGVPLVSLFGPTDHRWTIIPTSAPEVVVLADETLPENMSANDHPLRCRIEQITVERVTQAIYDVLKR